MQLRYAVNMQNMQDVCNRQNTKIFLKFYNNETYFYKISFVSSISLKYAFLKFPPSNNKLLVYLLKL